MENHIVKIVVIKSTESVTKMQNLINQPFLRQHRDFNEQTPSHVANLAYPCKLLNARTEKPMERIRKPKYRY